MNACLCTILAATLAGGPAPGRPTFTQLESKMQSHVEQQRHADLAQDAEAAFERTDLTPTQRRAMALFAVHGLHRLFEATWEPETVCHARSLLDRAEREVGLGNDAPVLERLRGVNAKYVAKLSRPCPSTRKASTRRPVACPTPEVKVEAQASCRAEASVVVVRPRVELLGADDPVLRAPDVPRSDAAAESRRHRTHSAIGGTLTAVGLGALAASAAGLGVMVGHAGTIREIARAPQAEQRPLTTSESQRIDAVYREAMSLRGPTIAAGVVGVVSLVAGVAVLATGRKAARRLAVTPHASALGGGLLLQGSF